jgi:hypothetical protein
MQKETFVNAINAIEKQLKKDREFAENLSKVFTGCFSANLLPDTDTIVNGLITVLESEMKDTSKWIYHFIFELDFGAENWRLQVYQNGKVIPLRTPTQLFYLLTKNMKNEKEHRN